MNPDPHLYGVSTVRHGCGKLAMQNVIRSFWQSRDPEHRLPELTDLPQLAKDIRRATATTTSVAFIEAHASAIANIPYTLYGCDYAASPSCTPDWQARRDGSE